ncbi:hypothetical protein MMC13_007642 [Lambiella insularis]|nr:hypothetical protein [Lambiella insularis]
MDSKSPSPVKIPLRTSSKARSKSLSPQKSSQRTPSKKPARSRSPRKRSISISRQLLKHKESRIHLAGIKTKLEAAFQSTTFQDTIDAYSVLIEDTRTHRHLISLKRRRLERQLINQRIKPEIFVKKSKHISQRWDLLGNRLYSLMRKKFQNEEKLRPSKLSEMGVGYSLLKRFLYDPRGKRIGAQQKQFRQDLIAQYDIGLPDGGIWDVILGEYLLPSYMKAAHLVPYSMQPEAIDYICGAGAGSRQFSWENGLMLQTELENHLDKGNIIIIPVTSDEIRPTRFMLRIAITGVAHSVVHYRNSKPVRLGELDGKELEWKNENRPMLRFLYWRYITSMLGNRKNRAAYAQPYYESLKSVRPFMSCKPYLRKGVLLTMAKEAGCVDDEIISTTLASITDDDDEIVNEYCMNEILADIALKERKEASGGDLDTELDLEDEESDDDGMVEEVSDLEDIGTDSDLSSDEE